MLGVAIVLSCVISVAAGLYVGVMMVREFPRLRNRL